MQVHCTSCGVQIPADDLNIATGIARCRACNAVFSFLYALQEDVPPSRAEREHAGRLPVAQPRCITVDDLGGQLRLVRRWFRPSLLFLVFFCVAWDGFLVFWYATALGGDAPLVAVLFPIVHVAVGLGLTYYVLCGFLNRTVIEVESGCLRIHHEPLPWPGNRTLLAGDLKQLYCKRRLHSSRNGTSETFELHALLTDGGQLKLLSGLEEAEQVLYLEQQLERCLGIQDARIAGEFQG